MKLFSFCLFVIILQSCNREKIVLDNLPSEHKLAVHCYLDADSGKMIVAKIFQANPVFGEHTSANNPLMDAVVEITHEGKTITLNPDFMSSDYKAFMQDGFISDNGEYELRISHPDYAMIKSKINLIPKYTTDEIEGKIKKVKGNTDSTYKINYEVNWADDNNRKNYFRIIPQIGYINDASPLDTFFMSASYGNIFLSDDIKKINNKIQWAESSDFYAFQMEGFSPKVVKVYILQVDETYYLYHQMLKQLNLGGISEAFILNGNIKGAYGIFAACHGLSEKTFLLE